MTIANWWYYIYRISDIRNLWENSLYDKFPIWNFNYCCRLGGKQIHWDFEVNHVKNKSSQNIHCIYGMYIYINREQSHDFYFTIRVWSSIVIVHEKSVFFPSFFRNISKKAETILIKKNWAKPWHFGLQKSSNMWTSKELYFSR